MTDMYIKVTIILRKGKNSLKTQKMHFLPVFAKSKRVRNVMFMDDPIEIFDLTSSPHPISFCPRRCRLAFFFTICSNSIYQFQITSFQYFKLLLECGCSSKCSSQCLLFSSINHLHLHCVSVVRVLSNAVFDKYLAKQFQIYES